jgi:hypothetical protein
MVATVLAATAFAAIAAASLAANPGVTVLAHRATQLLHSKPVYRNAILLEAEGSPIKPGHPVWTADKIIRWRFVFDNQKSGDKYKSVAISAVHNELGKPRGSTVPFLQDQPMNPIPKMTFTRAVQLLDAAGWTKGFFAVTLRKPDYPGVKDVEYIFAMVGGKVVAVDAQTGKVSKIS